MSINSEILGGKTAKILLKCFRNVYTEIGKLGDEIPTTCNEDNDHVRFFLFCFDFCFVFFFNDFIAIGL